jgi:hypothetical protein
MRLSLNQETAMKLKKLLVVVVAGAFALPFAAQVSAAGDRIIVAEGPSGASSTGTGPTGGVASPQSAGEPKAATDKNADTRRCEAMTGVERENCMRDARAPGSAADGTTGSATSGATTSPSGSAVTPGGSGKTGTTAGPGEASPRTAPSSDTATSPSTSGAGKAQ